MLSNKKTNFIHIRKEIFLSSSIILLCLVLATIFPFQGAVQNLTKNIFFLIILPFIYIKFIINKNISDFGFNLKNKREGLLWSGIALLASCLIFFLLAKTEAFRSSYYLANYVINNFGLFLLYELIFVNFFFFIHVFFFQGFVLFSFSKKFGLWAIAIQFFVYFLYVFITKGIFWQISPYLIWSLLGGMATYKSKSFLYSYFAGLLFMILLDAYLIYTIK